MKVDPCSVITLSIFKVIKYILISFIRSFLVFLASVVQLSLHGISRFIQKNNLSAILRKNECNVVRNSSTLHGAAVFLNESQSAIIYTCLEYTLFSQHGTTLYIFNL